MQKAILPIIIIILIAAGAAYFFMLKKDPVDQLISDLTVSIDAVCDCKKDMKCISDETNKMALKFKNFDKNAHKPDANQQQKLMALSLRGQQCVRQAMGQ